MQLSDISPEGQSRSQPMNSEQFSAYAQKGQDTLTGLKQSNPEKTVMGAQRGVYTSPANKNVLSGASTMAYNATREPWGGTTQHPGTGASLQGDPDQYAVSTKAPGQQSVTVPATVNQEQFHQAYKDAAKTFKPQLQSGSYLGSFHNAETGNIEFDPSAVVKGEETAKQVGAATNAVGGAYHFGSGNGVYPPHVA